MEEWLHCNHCVVRFSNKCTSFVVTNCAHVFCSKCERQATNPVCIVCQRKCTSTLLNDKVDARVAAFFKPPSDLRKKALELQKKADEAQKFQENQLRMLRKSESAKFDQHNKLYRGALQAIEQLRKENSEMKKIILRNKNNINVSPNSSFHISPSSPDRSPLASPSRSPMRVSPHKYKATAPQHYSSMPCSPSKPNADSHMHNANKSYSKSPTDLKKRVSMRSPPVDGKLYPQSFNHSPNRGHPYKSPEGVVSKQATISTSPQQSTPFSQFQKFMLQSPKTFGTTPPSTPKYPIGRGSVSCPVTPEARNSSFYSRMQMMRN